MPVYTYRCGTCEQSRDAFNKVDDRDCSPECCGQAMARQFTAPMVQVPGGIDVNYRCPMSGEVVQSMKRRKYLMEKHGVVDSRELTDTWKKNQAARQAEQAEMKAAYDALPEAVKKAGEQLAKAPA
jgi:putative FmdB family regulatory protein